MLSGVPKKFKTAHYQLIGVVDSNEVIVSPEITGRIVKLTVDEGSEVKKGELIAELDRKGLEASLAAALANVTSLEAQVRGANSNYSWTNDQTDASLEQAWATLTSTRAKLEQARANLWCDQLEYDRTQEHFDGGVASALDRYHVDATLPALKAHVKALEDSVKA
jgi:multidrug resistance efflux pump